MYKLLFLLITVGYCYALEPITECNFEVSENKSVAMKWIGMISVDQNNLHLQCIVIRDLSNKIAFDWLESGKALEASLVSKTDSSLIFNLVYPNNRGLIKVAGRKVNGEYIFIGSGKIRNELADGSVLIEIKSVEKIELCGKKVVWRF